MAMTYEDRVGAMLLCFISLGAIAIWACAYCMILLVRIKRLTAHIDRRAR